MSIFKDSFHQSIKDQISTRQVAINNRTPTNLQYYNSRNSWIRLSSSVNIYNGTGDIKDPTNYGNDLAKRCILQGGILYNKNLRSGIGDNSKVYSNISSNNTDSYRLGIRPMPGINNIEVSSKGAYGSLREAIVHFQCWDIKQLEDLELLYMRPGYTVLLEWGWSPHLKNGTSSNNYTDNKFNTIIDYTDIIETPYTKEELFKKQYTKATTETQGNCDSMYGYIKNYSWKARMDGGYDCQTTIISIGEIIESLKINYSPLDNITALSAGGLVSPNIQNIKGAIEQNKESYSHNILAGIFNEIWWIGRNNKNENTDNEVSGVFDVLSLNIT